MTVLYPHSCLYEACYKRIALYHVSCNKRFLLPVHILIVSSSHWQGVQWLSGRLLVWRSRGFGLESHRGHCFLSLSKTPESLLSTVSTQEDPSRHS